MEQSHELATNPEVRDLVDQLVGVLMGGVSQSSMHGRGEQLLDVEVNGVRCRCQLVTDAGDTSPAVLSPREREIVWMVSKGHTNLAIADVLGISTSTVSTYLRRIFTKLRVKSRAAMVAYVLGAEYRSRGSASPIVER